MGQDEEGPYIDRCHLYNKYTREGDGEESYGCSFVWGTVLDSQIRGMVTEGVGVNQQLRDAVKDAGSALVEVATQRRLPNGVD